MYKIEKGVPMPKPRNRVKGWVNLSTQMESGDSIFIPYDLDAYRAGEGAMVSLSQAIRRSGHKAVSTTVKGEGWRVWKL